MNDDHTTTRTYRLDSTTIERIDQYCKKTGCWQSRFIDLLLKRALDEVEAGRWHLDKRPVAYELEWKEK